MYVLLIAADRFDNFPPLDTPMHDAESLSHEFSRSCVAAETELFKNPTRSEILAALSRFAARGYESEDQLVIFFAGRAIFDPVKNQSFLVARDSEGSARYNIEEPKKLNRRIEWRSLAFDTYISATQLAYSIDNIPARHIMLIVDASFSGITSELR
jgi:hypothetical protein